MSSPIAQSLQAAIESCDYVGAGAAADEYLAWFQSAPRTIEDVEAARDLLAWALQGARAAKLRMTGEMAFLPSTLATHTWEIDV
jgi:hypothetical protein